MIFLSKNNVFKTNFYLNIMEKELSKKIITLYNKFKNDEFILNKLVQIIDNLDNTLQNEIISRNKKIELSNRIWNSQIELLSVLKKKYEYSYFKQKNLFFIKNNDEYLIIKEDDIYLNISDELNNFPILLPHKFKTINYVMKQIKEDSLLNQKPSANKIEEITEFFVENIFICENDKTYSKYQTILFFICLGEIIFKKCNNLTFFINPSLKSVISLIDDCIFNKSRINSNFINGNFISKYHKDQERNNYRVLFCNNNIDLEKISKFLLNYPITFLLVCCNYLTKYDSTNNFISIIKDNSSKLFENIHFLNEKTNEEIIKDFVKFSLETDSQEKLPITWKNMLFIWNNYLDIHNLPNMMYAQSLKEEVDKLIKYDCENDVYINVTSKYLPKISDFLTYWDENFIIYKNPKDIYTEEGVYELEIEELIILYKNQKKISINKNELEKIINYYYPSVIIENQKIQNVKCKIWDKNKEIEFYLENIVEKTNLSQKVNLIYNGYKEFYKESTSFCSFKYFSDYLKEKN